MMSSRPLLLLLCRLSLVSPLESMVSTQTQSPCYYDHGVYLVPSPWHAHLHHCTLGNVCTKAWVTYTRADMTWMEEYGKREKEKATASSSHINGTQWNSGTAWHRLLRLKLENKRKDGESERERERERVKNVCSSGGRSSLPLVAFTRRSLTYAWVFAQGYGQISVGDAEGIFIFFWFKGEIRQHD